MTLIRPVSTTTLGPSSQCPRTGTFEQGYVIVAFYSFIMLIAALFALFF